MLRLYTALMRNALPVIMMILHARQKVGKEPLNRFNERVGIPQLPRPDGALLWIHGASVGEAQSALILLQTLLARFPKLNILVTTGTLSSAQMMENALPDRAFHQFFPVDRPDWAAAFLDHWHPDYVIWIESELWPNMLLALKAREIQASLVNARMSQTSFRRWSLFKTTARQILSAFQMVLCQTETDAGYYTALGASQVHISDNLKHSARPLPADEADLKALNAALLNRPRWVYASTHDGEEALAARVHSILKNSHPDLLSIIVPRHPERRAEIQGALTAHNLISVFRGNDKTLPDANTDIYIADTLGELGLFYRAAPIACIGRSFSNDGGGGHNPLEAAQLHCAVLHGPDVQNLRDIFDDMNTAGAARRVVSKSALSDVLHQLLSDPQHLLAQQEKAYDFSAQKRYVLDTVMNLLSPRLEGLDLPKTGA